MAIMLPVSAVATCDKCKKQGMVSMSEWEIGQGDIAVVANAKDLARDGFVVEGVWLVCKECAEK